MPFIRHTRDKRGFEQTYVMHVARSSDGAQRTRVLYLFRTPGNLKVGRTPLDAEVMEALEHTHPDLSFDWASMPREAVAPRADQTSRSARGSRPRPSPPSARSATGPEAALPADHSALGRVAGAAVAARVRRRHAEVGQRIGRRARSPEERARLLDRLGRLNPDSWPEGDMRAGLSTFDSDLDALAAELPSRRRGRRGGRREDEGRPGASGIMAQGESRNADSEDSQVDSPGGAPDTGGDAGHGAAESEADLPGDN